MTDEEKKVIEYFKRRIANKKTAYTSIYFKIEKLDALINLIDKQSKEIEHQKEKRENQRQELAILNAKQIEFNKLKNTVNSYKGQFKRQQKEIEELKDESKEYQIGFAQGCYEKDLDWKDKIKAKIEEQDETKQYWTDEVKDILKSLLKKEQIYEYK